MSASSAGETPVGLQPDGQIISRCGLICNTCTAYMTGACPGCHALEAGECVLRDCADLRGTSCLDCRAPSCYHFEAYHIRRQLMNSKAKRYHRLINPAGAGGEGPGGAARAGCCRGGCGAGGGCACPAARLAERLAALVGSGTRS